MFTALALSLVFTFVYATAAARSRRAEKVLIPLLDILQSVPILGFLSVTITGVHRAIPGLGAGSGMRIDLRDLHVAGVEHDVLVLPLPDHAAARARRGIAAAAALRLAAILALDVPNGMIALVWNGMMSFGGGWFFLAASEAISVNNHDYALPGIGAYVAAASDSRRARTRSFWRSQSMIVMVVGVNVLFWRPLDRLVRALPRRGL